MKSTAVTHKPHLRGHFHQAAFFSALGACPLLVLRSSNKTALIASLVYSVGLLLMFGLSALYHRPNWKPRARAIMKSLDHCAIFITIAGAFTPICMLALKSEDGSRLLAIAWIAAGVGVLQSIFWGSAPKWVTALFYVGVGWLAVPYLAELQVSLGSLNLSLIVVGGVVYTVGAIFYAIKWPKPDSIFFGYHELFHLLTIVGALCHFAVIYQLIK